MIARESAQSIKRIKGVIGMLAESISDFHHRFAARLARRETAAGGKVGWTLSKKITRRRK